MNIIESKLLINMYSKGFFPMAKNRNENDIHFYKPLKRFLLPIFSFHIPKKLFKEFKKKNIFSE